MTEVQPEETVQPQAQQEEPEEAEGQQELSQESALHMDESNKNPNVMSLLGHDPFAQEEITLKQKKEIESYLKDLHKGQKKEERAEKSSLINIYDTKRVNLAPKPNQDLPKTFEDRVKIDIDNIKTVADLKNQKTKVKEYDFTYFQEGKLMRREIGNFDRTDFIQDAFTLEKWTIYDDLVSRLKLSTHEIDMIPKDSQGGLTWDPDSPGYFEQPLRCKYPGCKNLPMWRCDAQQSYLRNVTYDRVWQGCNALVCEAHVVKYFDKTDENLENTFWDQKEYFYDYERIKLTPK